MSHSSKNNGVQATPSREVMVRVQARTQALNAQNIRLRRLTDELTAENAQLRRRLVVEACGTTQAPQAPLIAFGDDLDRRRAANFEALLGEACEQNRTLRRANHELEEVLDDRDAQIKALQRRVAELEAVRIKPRLQRAELASSMTASAASMTASAASMTARALSDVVSRVKSIEELRARLIKRRMMES